MLIDSAAILDHLDEQAGDAALIPGAVVYERHFHSPQHRGPVWLDLCLGQTRAGLDEQTRRLATPYACGPTLTHAGLIALAEHCERLPAFRAAALSDFETMPRS